MKTAALHNLGCKVNSYETEAMREMLENAGYKIVDFHDVADVYVINTCSVTNMADRKSRQMLHRAKKQNPDAIVVGCGCYVQTSEKEALADTAVDIIIGNDKKHELVDLIEEFEKNRTEIDAVIDINEKGREFETLHLSEQSEHSRAFIKVQDGCNQFCSYCIIPFARGRVRSRQLNDILDEVSRMTEKGYSEFVLSGIHLSSYGVDSGASLITLIEAVAAIEKVERIRLGSFEPMVVTEDFVKRLAEVKKVCPHFHLSLQSGCDGTLKRMNRRYTSAQFKEKCDLFRKYFDNPALTTDVIVGFPGETDEEFEETKKFLDSVHFYELHVFKYSKRKGTVAAGMKDQIDEKIKTERSAVLIKKADEMSEEFRQSYLNKDVEVLVEEKVKILNKEYGIGFTKEYIKVAIPSGQCEIGDIIIGKPVSKLKDDIYLLA
ncbi:MAG: tRNA (N(6)-L-threonylcarbamoyladenosine(37)-C(2))-methylthiotransferase MtaB [Lachnospiraceae bacterium]|nr:tRNA (N(6)-L-threonylcarbamoyladenosine(37)-C(2))-methylthiotransferase MtaB [Lachnospiraceae bacterium]